MKERAYPVYTVNKHAEGLLVGGHPWVYENDILGSPEAEPENGTLVDVVSTKGAYLGTGFVSLKSGCGSSPATPTTPLMPPSGAPGRIRLGLPQDRAGARRPDRLPCHLWRG